MVGGFAEGLGMDLVVVEEEGTGGVAFELGLWEDEVVVVVVVVEGEGELEMKRLGIKEEGESERGGEGGGEEFGLWIGVPVAFRAWCQRAMASSCDCERGIEGAPSTWTPQV